MLKSVAYQPDVRPAGNQAVAAAAADLRRIAAHDLGVSSMDDRLKCQTATATSAEPGELRFWFSAQSSDVQRNLYRSCQPRIHLGTVCGSFGWGVEIRFVGLVFVRDTDLGNAGPRWDSEGYAGP